MSCFAELISSFSQDRFSNSLILMQTLRGKKEASSPVFQAAARMGQKWEQICKSVTSAGPLIVQAAPWGAGQSAAL